MTFPAHLQNCYYHTNISILLCMFATEVFCHPYNTTIECPNEGHRWKEPLNIFGDANNCRHRAEPYKCIHIFLRYPCHLPTPQYQFMVITYTDKHEHKQSALIPNLAYSIYETSQPQWVTLSLNYGQKDSLAPTQMSACDLHTFSNCNLCSYCVGVHGILKYLKILSFTSE